MLKISHLHSYLNLGNRFYICSCQRGFMLLESLLIAVFLGAMAVGVTYFFTQNRVTMSSSSQVMGCQTIVKQALERTVSLGTRLYGYKINNNEPDLQYSPLFIKGSGSHISDVGDGSYLGRGASKFPPKMYTDLFTNLVGVATPSSRAGPLNSALNPEKNSQIPIIRNPLSPTDLFEFGTSALFINSVNALQYLYNADPAYFDVRNSSHPERWLGKKYGSDVMSNGLISEVLGRYKRKFNLKNVELYIRIVPIDLNTDKLITSYGDIKCQKTTYNGTSFDIQDYSCPVDSGHILILSRPHFLVSDPNLQDQISRDLVVVGNKNIGFEIKVHLKYESGDEQFSCNAMHRFSHQNKTITGRLAETSPLSVQVTGLRNGTGRDLFNSKWKQTSCDQFNGVNELNYKNITLDLDFNGFRRSGSGGEEFGTLILCKGKMACRSGGDGSYPGCSVKETGWQRCHELKFPEQNGDTKAELLGDDKLKLTFNDLTENRRYDLSITEISMLEWSKRSVELQPNKNQTNIGIGGIKTVRFYIDALRPQAASHEIPDGDVGEPNEGGRGGRNYLGPLAAWQKPLNSLPDQWLQCNTSNVNFNTTVLDQFTHNLKPCIYKGQRKDGHGTTNTTGDITNQVFNRNKGECVGRLMGIDHGRQTISAEPRDTCGLGPKKDLVWDTDLPGTFIAQDVGSEWFYSTSKIPYAIKTKVPSINSQVAFPKHYSVDCVEREYSSNIRTDGNGGTISCEFVNGSASRDDGCNPEKAGIKYYHVCGVSQCKGGEWGVFAAYSKSCQNVQCEPGLICCDGFKGECGGVSKAQCARNTYSPSCSDPKGGGRAQQDNQSGCPPLGLYNCSYEIPCYATRPYPKIEACSSCIGKRNRNSCSFKRKFICQVQGSRVRSDNNFTGICMTDGAQRLTCNNIKSRCSSWEAYSVTKQCKGGTSCNETHYRCNQYTASDGICEVTFSGRCGSATKGSCVRLGVGGGNTSQDKCDVRSPTCSSYTKLGRTGPSNSTNSLTCNTIVNNPILPPEPPLVRPPSIISCNCSTTPTITTITTPIITTPTVTATTSTTTPTNPTTTQPTPDPQCGGSSPSIGTWCNVGRATDCHCSTSTACSYLCSSGGKIVSCSCYVSDR